MQARANVTPTSAGVAFQSGAAATANGDLLSAGVGDGVSYTRSGLAYHSLPEEISSSGHCEHTPPTAKMPATPPTAAQDAKQQTHKQKSRGWFNFGSK